MECALSRHKYDTYVCNVSHPEGETQSCDHDRDERHALAVAALVIQ